MAFRPFSDIGNFKFIITAKAVYAPVAEQADAPDSGSGRGDSVQVRFLSGAPNSTNPNPKPIGEGFGFVIFIDYPNFNSKRKN